MSTRDPVLHIQVMFLDEYYHGSQYRDPEDGTAHSLKTPEWPPSPYRLFQAFLAAAASLPAHREAVFDALRWLESQPPPEIAAPPNQGSAIWQFYVPQNQLDVQRPGEAATLKTVARTRLPRDATVHYFWRLAPDDQDAARHAQVIAHLARRLVYLGTSLDLVAACGAVIDAAAEAAFPGIRWTPSRHRTPIPGLPQLRVPKPGSLQFLLNAYRTTATAGPPSPQQDIIREHATFRLHTYVVTPLLLPRHYAVFKIDGPAHDHQAIFRVAAMLRHAAIQAALRNRNFLAGYSIEAYVAGHLPYRKGPSWRLSYVPLPSIGHEHSDGMIRRVLIAEPPGDSGAVADLLQQCLNGATLRDLRGGDAGTLLAADGRKDPVTALYTGKSARWLTVTPAVLPGYDDRKLSRAEELAFRAIEHAGIPLSSVRSVRLQKAPFWPGALHAAAYRVPRYLEGRPRWHVEIILREPVLGPIAIGDGRHCGLGLMARPRRAP